jgi:hypothetical protein
VQAHEGPKHSNTNAPRSMDCIYLRPMDNAQGEHELLHLQTNKIVKRSNLTKIPITPSIIKQVHALAELNEMPADLKITNRANQVIFNSAWIAGVDYDEDLFDDDDHNEEEDGDDNEDNEDEENYDEMDENDLADIIQQPNEFQVPHETENEHNFVFEEASNAEELQEEEEEEELSKDDDDEEYEPGNEEDISLEADDDDGEEEDDQGNRRTRRVRVPPQSWQHLQARDEHTEVYSSESAQIIVMTMVHFNTALAGMNDIQASSFLQTYSLKQGIKKFGKQGIAAVHKEMKQILDQVVFEPISIEEMMKLEKKRAMESLIFLTEKRDETVNAQGCANGSTQRA